MNSSSEKLAFSERLRQQLAARHWPVNSPTWLSREFNVRYPAKPVSVQTASNWLMGQAIPSQDKLLVLASWLEVSTEWLRFGQYSQTTSAGVAEQNAAYHGVRVDLSDLPSKLAKLNPRQKQAIYDVVEAMLETHSKRAAGAGVSASAGAAAETEADKDC